MITNREEVIDRAFGVFVKMNYEKASITTLAKACGLTKTGITYYFPHKQDLFIATADKFLFYMQSPTNKFKVDTETLEEFIEEYINLKSATKLFSVLLASKRPLITELADKLRLKYPLLPTISPCPTMRLEAIRSIIPISCRRYPKSV